MLLAHCARQVVHKNKAAVGRIAWVSSIMKKGELVVLNYCHTSQHPLCAKPGIIHRLSVQRKRKNHSISCAQIFTVLDLCENNHSNKTVHDIHSNRAVHNIHCVKTVRNIRRIRAGATFTAL